MAGLGWARRSTPRGRALVTKRAEGIWWRLLRTRMGFAVTVLIATSAGAFAVMSHDGSESAVSTSRLHSQVVHETDALLTGIPQHGSALGQNTAPVTLQIFGDLECLTVKNWVILLLPAIIKKFVRRNIMKIEYRALETDTQSATVFLDQQTAALAAGEQNRMWNFIETFYREQGKEYTSYVTEDYLDMIASQVPGLDLIQWARDRTKRLARRVVADDHEARSLGDHDTPAFLIGRTGGKMKKFVGRKVIMEFAGQGLMKYPVSLIDTQDLAEAIQRDL